MQKQYIFILFLFLSLSSIAQFSIGVRQGYGIQGLYLEPPGLERFQTNYWRTNFGAVISFVSMQNTGLQTEINYAQKGWKEFDDTVRGSYFIKRINYLEIPILSHFEIGQKKIRPIIIAGPYIGFKLNESSSSENFSHAFQINSKYDHYSQKAKDLNLGIKVGLGLRYNINKHLGVYIEGRYQIDLAGGTDVFKDHPNGIQASRIKEMSGCLGVVWHIIPQKKAENKGGYVPKKDLFD